MIIKRQFSLRLLLSVITTVAILLGWKTNREYQRERAIAALSDAGATVVVADTLPEWVKRILGESTGDRVIAVGSRGAWRRSDSRRIGGILHLGLDTELAEPMSDIEAFFLLGCDQGDNSFVQLRRLVDIDLSHLAKLRWVPLCLLVCTPEVTDSSLAYICVAFAGLSTCCSSDTAITDAGLSQLHDLKSLRHIFLDGTQVTSAGIEALERAIPGLEVCLTNNTGTNLIEPPNSSFNITSGGTLP